ncbi:MAG TPA: LptA/OstA family protein [Acidisarcina sp.]
MRVTIERLRTGIIIAAILLVAAIASFLVFARYERQRLVRDLPAKLGIQIQESADGFTLSKSDKGHTLFTIHASKAVQYKGGGHATLHDVSIALYGPKGDRADRIHGAEFDYDPATGRATALGEVAIDLQAPPPAASAGPNGKEDDGAAPVDTGKGMIHVKTNGLVFDRDTGKASTEGLVEFQMPQGAGHATGASYDSREGVLVLDSGVELDSSSNGKPLSLKAAHAQVVRDSRQAFLLDAVASYESERTSSDEAIVYFRADGTLEHVDASGHVHLVSDAGEELKAPKTTIFFDAHSQPLHAEIGGGVFFVATDATHHMHGDAVEAKLQFGDSSTLRHLRLTTAVSFVDQQVALPDDPNGSTTREVRADQIDVDFTPEPEGSGEAHPTAHSVAQRVLATGAASVVLHTISAKRPQQNTTIGADTLLANIGRGNTVRDLTGTGHTRIVDVASDGATQTSTADNLVVTFLAINGQRKPGAKEATLPATEIQSAVQRGRVTITQTPAVGVKSDSIMHITAQLAEYHADDQALHLEGSPRFNDGSIDLSADSMVYQRSSGNAIAKGNVKATFLEAAAGSGTRASASGHASLALGGQGPAHIVSDTATLNRGGASPKSSGGAKDASNVNAIFRGHARLWQGSNSISAPVIELSRSPQSLKAHGENSDPMGDQVTATLAAPASKDGPASVDRIQSRQLTYVDNNREASFSGAVVAKAAAGTIHADQATVFLVPAARSANGSSPSPPSSKVDPLGDGENESQARPSQIDHIVATGHVILDQPGRRATGEKLLYTAQDGSFTLTGSAAAPPRLVDDLRGTVTGASLIFDSHDGSVSVSGGQARASTDSRVSR